MEKKVYLVLENSIKKKEISNEFLYKKYSISKKSVKFSDLSIILELKKIKLPLYYQKFLNYKDLKKYLDNLEKKNTLPVLIKIKCLVFKSINELNLYSLNYEEVVKKINSLNTNFVKLILVLKHLSKKLS